MIEAKTALPNQSHIYDHNLCSFSFSLRSGEYGDAVTVQTLKDFHRERVKILVDAGADLIAFETIPNKLEAQVFY